jgi:hypothetical protein
MKKQVIDLFYDALNLIKCSYPSYGFIVKRDLVWTVQKHMAKLLADNGLPFKVFNDYPMEKGEHRSISVAFKESLREK